MSFRLSKLQTKILLAVVKYRYLTNSQLKLMELGNLSVIRRASCHLAKTPQLKPLLKVKKYPAYAHVGRLEHVYSPTRHGVEVAAEILGMDFQELQDQEVKSFYDDDFFHRRATITFRILLEKQMEVQSIPVRIERYENYFDKTGANHRKKKGDVLHAKTRIPFRKEKFFVPDSIFLLRRSTLSSKEKMLVSVEVIFGNKVGRSIEQIQRHMKALSEGIVTEKYKIPAGQDYLSLFLFHDAKLMNRVREELTKNKELAFSAFSEHFLFASLKDIHLDALNCWRKASPEDRYFYNFVDASKAFKVPYS